MTVPSPELLCPCLCCKTDQSRLKERHPNTHTLVVPTEKMGHHLALDLIKLLADCTRILGHKARNLLGLTVSIVDGSSSIPIDIIGTPFVCFSQIHEIEVFLTFVDLERARIFACVELEDKLGTSEALWERANSWLEWRIESRGWSSSRLESRSRDGSRKLCLVSQEKRVDGCGCALGSNVKSDPRRSGNELHLQSLVP